MKRRPNRLPVKSFCRKKLFAASLRLRNWVCLGLFWLRIGFDWVCFAGVCKVVYFRNPLCKLGLRSFEHSANWVCFALLLAFD